MKRWYWSYCYNLAYFALAYLSCVQRKHFISFYILGFNETTMPNNYPISLSNNDPVKSYRMVCGYLCFACCDKIGQLFEILMTEWSFLFVSCCVCLKVSCASSSIICRPFGILLMFVYYCSHNLVCPMCIDVLQFWFFLLGYFSVWMLFGLVLYDFQSCRLPSEPLNIFICMLMIDLDSLLQTVGFFKLHISLV